MNGKKKSTTLIYDHLKNSDGCSFEEVICYNNCDKFLQQKYLNNHLENHITDELQHIEGSHMEKCLKFPLPCPGISAIPREDMDGHRKVCSFEEVECPNKCSIRIQRQCLQNHVENECSRREINFQYCQAVGEHQFIEGEHTSLCPKYPLVCPNDCKAKNIIRENLQAHKKECPLEKIQCQYFSVGCSTLTARKDLQNHNQEKMEEHLSSTMAELVSIKDKLAATEQQLTFTEETLVKTEQRLAINEQQLMLTK